MAPVLQRLAKNVIMVNGFTEHMAIKNKDATSKHAKIITLTQRKCTLVQNVSKAVAKA